MDSRPPPEPGSRFPSPPPVHAVPRVPTGPWRALSHAGRDGRASESWMGGRRRHQGHTLGFLAQSPPIQRETDGRVCTELSATTRRAGRGPGALPRARAWKPRFTGGSHLRPLAEQRRRGLAGARRPPPPRGWTVPPGSPVFSAGKPCVVPAAPVGLHRPSVRGGVTPWRTVTGRAAFW